MSARAQRLQDSTSASRTSEVVRRPARAVTTEAQPDVLEDEPSLVISHDDPAVLATILDVATKLGARVTPNKAAAEAIL